MNKTFAIFLALAAALGIVIAIGAADAAPSAEAASRCDTAKAETDAKQTAYNDALSAAEARAKELGLSETVVADAKAALNDGIVTDAEKSTLLAAWAGRDTSKTVDLVNDMPKLKAVLDSRLALNAAIAAQNVECGTSEPVSSSSAVETSTSAVVPSAAPAAGDGSAR